MNVFYTHGNFKAGMRIESYLPRIQGYPARFDGTGLGMRYIGYSNDFVDVTLGSFYEQFGAGLALRAYEDRALGYDNLLDGARLIIRPTDGFTIKGVYGYQRLSFDAGRIVHGDGIVRGIDGEIHMNEVFKFMKESSVDISLGGSFVSKYQYDNDSELNLPENVGAYGGRAKIMYKNFFVDGEYEFEFERILHLNWLCAPCPLRLQMCMLNFNSFCGSQVLSCLMICPSFLECI